MADKEKGRPRGRVVLENLKRNGDESPITPLQDGEQTRPHRIRASAEVQEWFSKLSAERRGALLTALMLGEQAAPVAAAAAPEIDATPLFDQPRNTADQPRNTVGSLMPDAEVSERLTLTGTVPEKLSDPQRRAVEHLQTGADLVRLGVAGQWMLILPDGGREKVAPGTVKALRGAGILQMG